MVPQALLSTVVICLAACWLCRNGVVFSPSLTLVVRHEAAATGVIGASEPQEVALPFDVEAFCLKESGDFAQEALRKEARALYAKLSHWDGVLAQLHQKYEPLV